MGEANGSIYQGRDPVELPAYSVPEAARLVGIPVSTARAWTRGQSQGSGEDVKDFEPLIRIDDPDRQFLSFRNLVELHVLAAIRRTYGVSLQNARKAIDFMEQRLGSDHPLACRSMLTDGKDLLTREGARLLNVSRAGQVEMDLVSAYLDRIEFDRSGRLARLFPFTTSQIENDNRAVVIDPRVQFGRPCLTGKGIPTEVVVDRFKAGERIEELAADYELEPSQVEEAIRYERPSRAA